MLIALTVAAYLPAIRGGFIWDDDVHVTQNMALRSLWGLKLIWTTPGATPQYYPLTHTSFWIEYHLWDGNALGYHLDNVILQIINAMLLWRVLTMLEVPGAFLAAALFALHPVQVETVAWISERKNLLCGFFYLLAGIMLLRALRQRFDWRWYVGGLVAFVAAELSKTVAGSLPAALLLVLWWKNGRLTRKQILATVPMFIIALAMGRMTAGMERTVVGAAGPEWNYSLVQRLLIAGRAVWFYLYKLIVPVNLNFIYPNDWKLSGAIAWMFPIVAAIVVVVLLLWRKRLGRGPLVAVLFFGGTLLPALGFVNIYPMRYSFVADHFQYLACIGIFTMIAYALSKLHRWTIIIPILLAALSFQRAQAFNNAQALWEDTLAKNPDAWIAHDQLGAILAQQGKIDEAAGHFDIAITLNPRHIEGYIGLGNLMMQIQRPQAAIEQMQKAVDARPDKPLAYYALGTAQLAAGQTSDAARSYEMALRIEPKFIPARLRLAEAYERLGQSEKSEQQKREAQRLLNSAFGYDARP